MPELTSEDAITQLFDNFVQAGTFRTCMSTFQQICQFLGLNPSRQKNFYTLLKTKVASWKAKSLWAKIDKRYNRKEYKRRPCQNTNVLVIGAGPVGLRTAIECAMLGARCIVIEKRESFSRNNVLHLWPFIITDLKNLGAKKFFGKFCAGAIDHISIRQLQLMLLKMALLLGVEVNTNVSFEDLQEPPDCQEQERVGWKAKLNPPDHPLSEYEFDVIVGADGKRNTLQGFKRKEFRGKLAIAITANFINRHTNEEAAVEEISGVAFIFNQKFFQDLKAETGIDLENIVYYRDDTHYFVMTAKKKSLLDKGVIIKDQADTIQLLSRCNHSHEKLQAYAREAADFSTGKQLPRLDFALNHYGQPDVAMFDFTSIFQSEHAARVLERKGHRLLMALVGDSLLEPFWPTGSGCARGFLGAYDAAWMVRSWANEQLGPMEVIAERESIYRLLPQTTPENLSKIYEQYGLTPSTRYPHINLKAVAPHEVLHLYDTDDEELKRKWEKVVPAKRHALVRTGSIVRSSKLLHWCQRITDPYLNVHIENMTSSWHSGLALCAIIHHYRPHLIDFKSLKEKDVVQNNQLAFDLAEREFSISPTMTGKEIAEMVCPDKLTMVAYISSFYDLFKDELPPTVKTPSTLSTIEEASSMISKSPASKASLLSRISKKILHKKSHHGNKENEDALSPVMPKKAKIRESPEVAYENQRSAKIEARLQERLIDRANERAQSKAFDDADLPAGTNRVTGLAEHLTAQFRTMAGLTPSEGTFETRRTAKIDARLQERLIDRANEKARSEANEKAHRETFDTADLPAGTNRVTGLAEHLTAQFRTIAGLTVTEDNKPLHNKPLKTFIPIKTQNSDTCFFCGKRVYVMERLSVEGLFFHRDCFRCQQCETMLHVGNYVFAKEIDGKGKFYCRTHYLSSLHKGMEGDHGKRQVIEEPPAPIAPPPTVVTSPVSGIVAVDSVDGLPSKNTGLLSEPSSQRYRATPERIELENIRASIAAGNVQVTEEEIAKYNLGTSLVQTSEEEDDDEDSFYSDMDTSETRTVYMADDVDGQTVGPSDEEEYSSEFESDDDDDDEADEEDSDEESDEESSEESGEESGEEESPSYSHINRVVTLKEQWLRDMKAPAIRPWRPPEEIEAEKRKEEEEEAARTAAEEARRAEEEEARRLVEEERLAEEERRRRAEQEEAEINQSEPQRTPEEKRPPPLQKSNSKLKFNLDALSQQYADYEEAAQTPVISNKGIAGGLTDDQKVKGLQGETLDLDGGDVEPDEKGVSDEDEVYSDDIFEMDIGASYRDTLTDATDEFSGSEDRTIATGASSSLSGSEESDPVAVPPVTDDISEIPPQMAQHTPNQIDSTQYRKTCVDADGQPRPRALSGMSDSSFTISTPSGSFSSISVCSTMTDPLLSSVGDLNPADLVDSSRHIAVDEIVELDLSVQSGENGGTGKPPVVGDRFLHSGEESPDVTAEAEDVTAEAEDVFLELGDQPAEKEGELSLDLLIPSGYPGNDVVPNQRPFGHDLILPNVDEDHSDVDAVGNPPKGKVTLSEAAVSQTETLDRLRPTSTSTPESKISTAKTPRSDAKDKPRYRPMYNKRDSGPRSVMSRSFSDSFKEMPTLDDIPIAAGETPEALMRDRTGNGVKMRMRPDSPVEYITPASAIRPTSIKMDTLSRTEPRERTFSGGTARDRVIKKKDTGSPKKSPKRQLPGVPARDQGLDGVTAEDREVAKKLLRDKTQPITADGRCSSSGSSATGIASPTAVHLRSWESLAGSGPPQQPSSSSSDQFFTPETDNPPTSEYLSLSPPIELSPLSDYSPSQFTEGIPQSESKSEERKSRLSRLRGDMRRREAVRKSKQPDRKAVAPGGKKSKKKKSGKSKADRTVDRSSSYVVIDSPESSGTNAQGHRGGDLEAFGATARPADTDKSRGKKLIGAAQLPRLIRKLSVDPNLSASLDLDEPSSSDDDGDFEIIQELPQTLQPNAGPVGAKVVGKSKSPKRMWGKRFKVITKKSPKVNEEKRKIEEEELNDKLTRRVQREAQRQHHQQQLKRHRMAQEIQRQLQEVEVKQRELGNRGVSVEKALRGEKEYNNMDESTLMQQWFSLVNEKNALVRYESELMVQAQELELEDRHCQLEQELRQRMAVEEGKKTQADQEVERLLLEEMLEVVEQRDSLVALLEEERLKEKKEDLDIEETMLKKGLLTARSDIPVHV